MRPLAREPLPDGRYPEDELQHLVRLVYEEDDAPPTRPDAVGMADPEAWPEGSPERDGGGALGPAAGTLPETAVLASASGSRPAVIAHTAALSTPEPPSDAPAPSEYGTDPPRPATRRCLFAALGVTGFLLMGLISGVVGFAASGWFDEPAPAPRASGDGVERADAPGDPPLPSGPAPPSHPPDEPRPVPSTPTDAAGAATPATELAPTVALDSTPDPPRDSPPDETTSNDTTASTEPAHLRVFVAPFGTATLDGRPIAVRRSHRVEPGEHRLVARSGGHRQARTIHLRPGQRHREVFRF